jgi:hypothetical protein
MALTRLEKRAKNRRVRRRINLIRWRIKAYLWRLTAAWCWLHILFFIFRSHDKLAYLESTAIDRFEKLLRAIDFAPGRLHLLPMMLKIFWILCICSFSITQIFGLIIYIAFAFITLIALIRKPALQAQYIEAKEKATQSLGPLQKKFRLQASLLASLIVWFVLYGSATSKGPLLVALILTGTFFIVRLSKATPYTTMATAGANGPLSWLSKFAMRYALNVIKQVLENPLTSDRLNASAKTQRWMLRRLRCISIYFKGTAGERRAALVVLTRYIYDLGLLGALLILFWALCIELCVSPHSFASKDAVMTSASHIIPGISETTGIALNRALTIMIPFSGWIMFVLFIGPVASMYPEYQKRYLSQMKTDYDTIRLMRGALYRLADALELVAKNSNSPKQLEIASSAEPSSSAPQEPVTPPSRT